MCGYWYSNSTEPTDQDLGNIKRRGPDGFKRISNSLGNFSHSLLITKPPKTLQPFVTKHGVLLYNGSIYNTKSNDTIWIANQLDNNLDTCLQVIKSMQGEYSLTYVTDDFVVFCTDQWSTRNLWYYYNKETKSISICSVPDVLRKHHIGAWPCIANKIYVLDKKTYSLRLQTNTDWNLDQKINHYDFVFEAFEDAVDCRLTDNFVVPVSSGYDSGVIACAALKQKLHSPHYCSIKGSENAKLLAERMKLHRSTLIPDEVDSEIEKLFQELTTQPNSNGLSFNRFKKVCEFGISRSKRIHLTGRGGDEIYGDYGFKGQFLTPASTFGGYFPDDLSLIWPWHTGRSFLYEAVSLQDFAHGFFGTEARVPLLDQKLVQAWINTSHKLKNKRYKGWMAEYMQMHNYPFCEQDLKLAGFDN